MEGTGELPQDGQEVVFDYTAYNESGERWFVQRPAWTDFKDCLLPGTAEGLVLCSGWILGAWCVRGKWLAPFVLEGI